MKLLAVLLAIAGAGMLCLVALGVFAWSTPVQPDAAAADNAAGVAARFLLWSLVGVVALVASVIVFIVAARRAAR